MQKGAIMPNGTIKKFNADKGFGFIRRSQGEDLFFHINDCRGFTPVEGMAVSFTEGQGRKGPAAKDVQPASATGQEQALPVTATTIPKNEDRSMPHLMLPQHTAITVRSAIVARRSVNPSLLLDRCIDAQAIEDQKNQRDLLLRVIKANAAVDPQAYTATIKRLEGDIPAMLLTSQSRIAIQLSRAAGLENANCCLHPVHGFAYLPGSGLKGLAHAYACHLYFSKNEATRLRDEEGITCEGDTGPWQDETEKEAFIRCIEDIFGWAPNEERQGKPDAWLPRSGRSGSRDSEQQRGLVVFHDAFADQQPAALELDVCTPHYGDYYKDGTTAPGDWLSPVPVTFLTIAAHRRWRFRVSAADTRATQELVNVAKRLLLGGLHWLGAGAKTAAGYGWFEDSWQESDEARAARLQAEADEHRRHIAAAQQRQDNKLVAIYESLDHNTELLWVPKADGSCKGARLIRENDQWLREDDWEFKKNPDRNSRTNWVFKADLHPEVAKRPVNPRRLEDLQAPEGHG